VKGYQGRKSQKQKDFVCVASIISLYVENKNKNKPFLQKKRVQIQK